jgi:hypothetical protein
MTTIATPTDAELREEARAWALDKAARLREAGSTYSMSDAEADADAHFAYLRSQRDRGEL